MTAQFPCGSLLRQRYSEGNLVLTACVGKHGFLGALYLTMSCFLAGQIGLGEVVSSRRHSLCCIAISFIFSYVATTISSLGVCGMAPGLPFTGYLAQGSCEMRLLPLHHDEVPNTTFSGHAKVSRLRRSLHRSVRVCSRKWNSFLSPRDWSTATFLNIPGHRNTHILLSR
jgi:hypothetical protein